MSDATPQLQITVKRQRSRRAPALWHRWRASATSSNRRARSRPGVLLSGQVNSLNPRFTHKNIKHTPCQQMWRLWGEGPRLIVQVSHGKLRKPALKQFPSSKDKVFLPARANLTEKRGAFDVFRVFVYFFIFIFFTRLNYSQRLRSLQSGLKL